MKKICLFALLSTFVFTSSFANQESNAKAACQAYKKALVQKYPGSSALSCEYNSRNQQQWDCMYQKRINEGWSFTESTTACFKDAPYLSLMQANQNIENIAPHEACNIAIEEFRKHQPNDKVLQFINCNQSSRTAKQWLCMEGLALQKNTFMFSSGQCFPRQG